MQIGTCSEKDPATGSNLRGDACPLDSRTIFVSVASYRDFQCRYTVESIFLRAKNPNRIRVGVVDQIIEGEDPVCDEPIEPCDSKPDQALCKYKDQVDILKVDAPLSIGPVFARVSSASFVQERRDEVNLTTLFGYCTAYWPSHVSRRVLHDPIRCPCHIYNQLG